MRNPRPQELLSAAAVVLDTTLPRHLALLGPQEARLLRDLFGQRATVPRAVLLELRQAVSYAPAVAVMIGPHGLLTVRDLDAEQTERAERLRRLLPVKTGKASENLGEAQAIILAKDLGCPLVIDEFDGTVRAKASGINALSSVYLLMLAALTGHRTDDEAWQLYIQLTNVEMKVAQELRWPSDATGQERFNTELAEWRAVTRRTAKP